MLGLVLLFVALTPGILVTLPPIKKKIFRRGKSNLLAACVHAVIFVILMNWFRITDGFQTKLTAAVPAYMNAAPARKLTAEEIAQNEAENEEYILSGRAEADAAEELALAPQRTKDAEKVVKDAEMALEQATSTAKSQPSKTSVAAERNARQRVERAKQSLNLLRDEEAKMPQFLENAKLERKAAQNRAAAKAKAKADAKMKADIEAQMKATMARNTNAMSQMMAASANAANEKAKADAKIKADIDAQIKATMSRNTTPMFGFAPPALPKWF